jgi:flagellar biosynthetic protein FliO
MYNPIGRFSNDPRLKKYLPILIIVLVVILFSVFVWAAYAAKTTVESSPDTSGIYADPTSITVNVALRLLFVLAIIYLCYAAYRWMQNRRVIQQPKKRLSVVETVRLSPRQAVHIVRVGSQEFLVGATDQTMNLISEIENPETTEGEMVEETQAPANGFDQVFQQSFKDSFKLFRGHQNSSS